MPIIGIALTTLVNGTPNDATPVNANFASIVSQVNANAAQLSGGNTFAGAQVVPTATARSHAARVSQVQDQAYTYCGLAGGVANAITLTPSIPSLAYITGQQFVFEAALDNLAGAVTVAVSGLAPAKNISLNLSTTLVAGAIKGGNKYRITLGAAGNFILEDLTQGSSNFYTLPVLSGPDSLDNLLVQDVSAAYPNAGIMSFAELMKAVTTFAFKAVPSPSADTLMIYDAGAGDVKRTTAGSFVATTAVTGMSRLATAAETLAGADGTTNITPAGFAGNKSIGASGYYKFPGGFMVQWGSEFIPAGNAVIAFPVAFSALYSVVCGHTSATVGSTLRQNAPGVAGVQLIIDGGGNSNPAYWIAIGAA